MTIRRVKTTKPSQPSVSAMAQIGGTYRQVLDLGQWVLAARTGGLEVLVWQTGRTLTPVSHLPLCNIPLLVKQGDRVGALFQTCSWEVIIDEFGHVSLHESSLDWSYSTSELPVHASSSGFSVGIGGANEGLSVRSESGNHCHVALPGYSRPSSIHACLDAGKFLVADVGRIHCVCPNENGSSTVDGYNCAGWPKDVDRNEQGVFCADVFGIRWYKEINRYPFIELVDQLSQVHYRIAKAISHSGVIIACDEARGIHFFVAEGERLKARGGLMLKGGAWDCVALNDSLLVASGDEGWCEIPFDWSSLQHGSIVRHYSSARVHSVIFWPQAQRLVVLSKQGASFAQSTPCEPLSVDSLECIVDGACWAALPLDSYLLIAAGDKGLYVIKLEEDGKILVHERHQTVEARDLCYDGKFIWLADGKGGIRCYWFDFAAGRLHYYGVFPVGGFSRGVMCADSRLYVGAGDGGLAVLHCGESS